MQDYNFESNAKPRASQQFRDSAAPRTTRPTGVAEAAQGVQGQAPEEEVYPKAKQAIVGTLQIEDAQPCSQAV